MTPKRYRIGAIPILQVMSQPVYELLARTTLYNRRFFGWPCQLDDSLFNDDHYGRALDKLFLENHVSEMTNLVLRLIHQDGYDIYWKRQYCFALRVDANGCSQLVIKLSTSFSN